MARSDKAPVMEDDNNNNDNKQEDDSFSGWLASSATSALTLQAFTPKRWQETDVDIAVSHCGVCASDLHTLRSGWGPTLYPVCLGHEIVGTAIRVGNDARPGIRVGDRVGVGPQGYTCRRADCEPCSSGRENYCPRRVATYGDKYANGSVSYGGFANVCRHDSHSVFSIPEGVSSADAAVMLCAGGTVYEPLKEHGGARTTMRVGVVGLGGLGHLAVLFAKAMGFAHVLALSRSAAKVTDALALGADEYVATDDDDDEDKDWSHRHASSLDLIICTVSSPHMPLQAYLNLLRPKGRFCQVGIPEQALPRLDAMPLVLNGTSLSFSDAASPGNVREMLELAARKGIKAWTQVRGMEEVNEVIGEMGSGKARFRFVLENR